MNFQTLKLKFINFLSSDLRNKLKKLEFIQSFLIEVVLKASILNLYLQLYFSIM